MRQRRRRAQQERILIDGAREIERAIEAGIVFQELFVSDAFIEQRRHLSYLARLAAQQVRTTVVPDRLLERIGYGQRNDGIVAVATPPEQELGHLSLPKNPLVAVLERVEKPGNLGAVIRTADAAGLDAVIAADSQTDLFNPNAIRASMGTIFCLPVVSATCEQVVRWLVDAKLQVAVARVDGSRCYDQLDYRTGTAFVLGSEARGVSHRWKSAEYTGVKLPMDGVADSLNVSVTAAVLFYEANRQRRSS